MSSPAEPEHVKRYKDYLSKKTIGEGLLDYSLLVSNITQLLTLIFGDGIKPVFGIYLAMIILIGLSMVLQVWN